MSGRYQVIRYPIEYAVQDMHDKSHKAVYVTKDRNRAHMKAKSLNKKYAKDRKKAES